MTISATAALLLIACGEDGGQQSAAAQLPEYTVKVAHPQVGSPVEYGEWVGRLQGMVSAAVLPQVSGYVMERLFINGQNVKTGQVLYRIDPTRYEQALAEAEQREQQALANEKEAAQHLEYNEPLVRSGAISRQTYTDAQQQLSAAQAAVAAAKAAADQAETNLGYCVLKSPIDGIAGFANADIGSYVAPGGSPMVVIKQVNPIRIQFSISSQNWLKQGGVNGALHPGAKVQILLQDGTPYQYPATIEGVDNSVITGTDSLLLDARTPNPDELLRPGMFVRVRAQVAEQKNALLVPVGAVVSIQGVNMVLVINENGTVRTVSVVTGLQRDGLVAVQGDLSPTDRIVVNGTQQALMAAEGRAKLNVEKL